MISLWKLREKENVAQMPFVKNTPEMLIVAMMLTELIRTHFPMMSSCKSNIFP